MRVLIAGCGYVGSEAGARLVRRGHRVWGLRRSTAPMPEGVEPIQADLLGPDLASRLPEVDAVVHAVSSDSRDPEAYETAYVTALEKLLLALPTRPRRLLYVSSTAVYGDAGGDWVDETTPPDPPDFRGHILLRGEALARAGAQEGVVVRLGGIYGPGRTRLIERVRAGEARCPGGGPLWSNRIHRDDAAEMLVHLLEHLAPAPVYLGVDDEPAPICEIYRYLAELLGASAPEIDPGLSRDRTNKRCSSARIRAAGFKATFPSYREGYRALIEEESAR
jgi:nucleoside-diphosphate-sugar epimerase